MTISSLSKGGYICSFLKVNGQRVPEPGHGHAKSSFSLRFTIISGADDV